MNIGTWLDSVVCIRLIETLGHFVWQGAAVGLLVFLAGVGLRRASPNARYTVWVAALAVMAACPVVTFSIIHGSETPAAIPSAEAASAPVTAEPSPVETAAAQAPSATTALGLQPATKAPVSAPAIPWQRYAPHAALFYVAGVLAMLGRLLWAVRGGQRLRRRSQPVDDPALLGAVARQAKALGLSVSPAIAYCEKVLVPTVVGVLRPMILIPAALISELRPDQVELLIAHELSHIRRYDHVVNIIQRVIEAVLFFHPAVWFVTRRIRFERELGCDEMAVAASGQRATYAAGLVRVAELCASGARSGDLASAAALGAGDRPSALRLRILRLLEGTPQPPVRLRRTWVVLVGMAIVAGFVTAPYLQGAPETEATGISDRPTMFATRMSSGITVELVGVSRIPDGREPPSTSSLDDVLRVSEQQIKELELQTNELEGILSLYDADKGRGVTPEDRQLVEQDPLIAKLKEQKASLELECQASLPETPKNKETLLIRRQQLEIVNQQLENMREKKLQESIELKREQVRTAYANSQHALQLARERLKAAEAKAAGATSERDPWWQPDGSPLPDPPQPGIGPTVRSDEHVQGYEFVARVTGTGDSDVSIEWALPAATATATGGRQQPSENVSLESAAAAIPRADVATTVRLGLSLGPWETLVASHGGVSYGLKNVSLLFTEPHETDGDLAITVAHSALEKEHRIVAVDSTGQEHVAAYTNSSGTGNLHQTTVRFPDLKPDQVHEFRFQVRPIEWAEFRSVSLKAGHRTDVQIFTDPDPLNAPLAAGRMGARSFVPASTRRSPEHNVRDTAALAVTDDPRLSRIDTLLSVIRESVAPDSWRENGGEASILEIDGQLVVTQSASNHRAVAGLLSQLVGREVVGAPTTGAAPSDEQQKLLAKLDEPVSASFDEVAFEDVINSWSGLGINVVVLWSDLEANGIDGNTLVTLHLVSKFPLRRVVTEVLHVVSGRDVELGFQADDGILRIATRDLLDNDLYTAVYDVRDLWAKDEAAPPDVDLPAPATESR